MWPHEQWRGRFPKGNSPIYPDLLWRKPHDGQGRFIFVGGLRGVKKRGGYDVSVGADVSVGSAKALGNNKWPCEHPSKVGLQISQAVRRRYQIYDGRRLQHISPGRWRCG